jgi:galactose mutarotase-like enzyme
MFAIENQYIRAVLTSKGAELQQLFSKEFQLDYLWNGDPAYWGKHSPVLFPIVGTLKENTYYHEGKTYRLPRHGFARDREFTVTRQHFDAIEFLLTSDEDTRKNYPFDFELRIGYRLQEDQIVVTYGVTNTGDQELLFSIGGHPAFRLPLEPGKEYSDYYLEFNEEETLPRWPISGDGLIEKHPLPLIRQTQILPLSKDLFSSDALVLKFPASSEVTVRSDNASHGIDFDFDGFPYLGLWAAGGADFLCIEPWCGIADSVSSDQILEHKEGIQRLDPGAGFERHWSVRLW